MFEIGDYTCATDYEKFIVDIEKALRKWQLYDGKDRFVSTSITDSNNSDNSLVRLTQLLKIGSGKTYILSLFYMNRDHSMSEFLPESTEMPLHRMSGIKSFLLLQDMRTNLSGDDAPNAITELDEFKLCVSGFAIALFNCKCSIPTFIHCSDGSQSIYHGISIDENSDIRYRNSVLLYIPNSYSHLNGLLDFYRENFDDVNDPDIYLRWTYNLSGGDSLSWPVFTCPIARSRSLFPRLPIGCRYDPISSLQLIVETGKITDNGIVENAVFSNFHPKNHLLWYLKAESQTDRLENINEISTFLMGRIFQQYTYSWVEEIQNSKKSSKSIVSVFDALRNRGLQLSSTVSIVDSEDVRELLKILFATDTDDIEEPNILRIDKKFPPGSVVPFGSFLHTMCLHLIRISIGVPGHEHMIPSMNSFLAVFWADATRVLRWHWENLVPIPRLYTSVCIESTIGLSLNWNILHQKLCMVNYCIDILRQTASTQLLDSTTMHPLFAKSMKTNTVKNIEQDIQAVDESDGEELFFDTKEDWTDHRIDKEALMENISILEMVKTKLEFHVTEKKVGHQLKNVTLINTGEPLMIPDVLNPGVMTQDEIDEQLKLFVDLGTSERGRDARMKMQSSQLLSDMQAFKAANSGAILEDFVKWHSPRDIDENNRLSPRMSEPNNIWQTLWNTARPLAASKQKPLFNAFQSGEKALHWMETLSTDSLMSCLYPIFLMSVLSVMLPNSTLSSVQIEKKCYDCEIVQESIKTMMDYISKLPWEKCGELFTQESVEKIINYVASTEEKIITAFSLTRKLGSHPNLANRVMLQIFEKKGIHTKIESHYREAVYSAFSVDSNSDSFNLKPFRREYIIQSNTGRNRLYVSLKEGETKMFETFSRS